MPRDTELIPHEIALDGKVVTSEDASTIGKNFQVLKNLRYTNTTPKGVGGMTKINTTVLADSYKHIKNGFHFKKEQPAETHVLVQATDTSDANPVILQNTTAISSQGDFSGNVLYTENTSAGTARFADAPNGQVAICDGKDALIWGGDENRISAFLTSAATITTSLTNPKNYTKEVQNTLTGVDQRASIGSGIDSDTVLMLHMDGIDGSTTFTDSSVTSHTVTAVGDAKIDTAQYKFGEASGLMLSSPSGYLSIPDHSDFDLSGGIWTIDFWIRFTTIGNKPIFFQSTNTNNWIQIFINADERIYFQMKSGGSTVVLMATDAAIVTASTWYHIAVVENGDNYYIFLDGIEVASTTDTDRPDNYTGNVLWGAENATGSVNYINSYFDEVRISNGVSRWTSDFTPLSSPYSTTALDFLVGSTRPLQGCKFHIPSGSENNEVSATLSMKEWNGSSWTTVSITDNTSGFENTGTVTWSSTVDTSKTRYLEGFFLYWYNFTLSDGNCEINQVTIDAPMQTVKDIWDGEFREVLSYKVFADSKYQDYTVNVFEDSYDSANSATYATLNGGGLTSSEYQLMGFPERLTGLNISFLETSVNAVSSTLTVFYWNGTTWISVGTIVDGTLEGSASFAKTGVISWQAIEKSLEFKTSITGESPLYYYKLQQDATMTADVKIFYIAGIPAQKDIVGYKFPFFADDALWLLSKESDKKNTAIRSMTNAPDVFNGEGSTELEFGDEKELVAATSLYSRLGSSIYDIKLVYKEGAMFGVSGSTVDKYNVYNISQSIGCVAPLTLDTAIIQTEQGTRPIAIWQADSGIYMFDNTSPIPLSGDIANFFDDNESPERRLHASYKKNSVGFMDRSKMEYHWSFADGNSTGDLNREWVFDLKRLKLFEISRGSGKELQCGFTVTDTSGNKYTYGTIDTGYMERLENGTDFDGTDITHTIHLGDIALNKGQVTKITKLRHFKLVAVSKTTTSNSITVTHYGNTSTTGTSFTLSTSRSGKRLINAKMSKDFGNHIFHSLKFVMITNDETYGFQPIYLGLHYQNVRDDIGG